MKTKMLADKTEIPDRLYYYVLDFLDTDRRILDTFFNKKSLHELTHSEFIKLFEHATECDLLTIKSV